jgi:hypothetical protein
VSFQVTTFKYELREKTHLGGLLTWGALRSEWYLLGSHITMDDHIDSMLTQGWNSPSITEMPGGKMKIATFQK